MEQQKDNLEHEDSRPRSSNPSIAQRKWLRRGLDQPGGKLPLFDEFGQKVNERTIKSCMEKGWVEPWFDNPLKRNWIICKLTASGERIAQDD